MWIAILFYKDVDVLTQHSTALCIDLGAYVSESVSGFLHACPPGFYDVQCFARNLEHGVEAVLLLLHAP